MKLLSSISLIAGLTAVAPFVQAETIEIGTTPVGVSKMTIQAGNTPIAPVFVLSSAFSGKSTAISESGDNTTITFSGTPFEAGEFDEGAEYPAFYIEVSSGTFEGFGYDIISNTANSVVVAGKLETQGLTSAESYIIRPHMTLDTLFANATGLTRRDLVKFYNPDGSSDLASWSGSEWNGGLSNRPIYPGTGVITGFNGDVTIITSGLVKTTKTVVPIYTAAGSFNLISSASPISVLLADMELGGQIERRDLVKFFESGSMATYALYSASGTGDLNLSSGTPVSDVYPGEAILISTNNELSITLPGVDSE